MSMFRRIPKIEKAHVLLLVSVTLGLGLRLYGIRWGLPDTLHPDYSYHPDEMLHLQWARMLVNGEIIGKHFMYGGTFYYTVLNAYFHFGKLLDNILGGFNNLANVILFGRYAHVAVAILTILIVYECGRVFYSKTIGGLAAVLLALMPAHILCAQRMRPDELAALFAALVLLLSWHIVSAPEENKRRFYVYIGLALGVATALRFPMAMLAGAAVTAHMFSGDKQSAAEALRSLPDRKLVILFGAMAAGYAVASPHTFIYPEWFIQGLRIQWAYQAGSSFGASGQAPGVYQYGWAMLCEALGYPLYFLALGGVILALVRRSRADIIILAVGIPYFILTTFASWVVVRYTLPLLPSLAVLAASFVMYVAERMPWRKSAVHVLFVALFAWTLLADYAYLKMEAGKDVRDTVTEWIQNNIRPGSSILTVRSYLGDYYFDPVVPQGYSGLVDYLKPGGDNASLFRERRSDYLILHGQVPDELLSHSRYKPFMVFRQPVEALGIGFSGWFTSHDYAIANPEIRLYRYQD